LARLLVSKDVVLLVAPAVVEDVAHPAGAVEASVEASAEVVVEPAVASEEEIAAVVASVEIAEAVAVPVVVMLVFKKVTESHQQPKFAHFIIISAYHLIERGQKKI
jgi:hypothetical protein